MKEDIAKILSDLGKLVFGSMVLGVIIRSELPQDTQLTIGGVAASLLLVVSLILGTREIKSEKPPSNRVGKTFRRKKRSKR